MRPETRALHWIVAALHRRRRSRRSPEARAWRQAVPLTQLPCWLRPPLAAEAFLAAVDARFPGTSAHLLRRKLWFFAQTRQTPAQILMLGPGLDGLPCSLRSRARVLEVDLPEVLRWRLQRGLLASSDAFPADLEQGLPQTLLRSLEPDHPCLCLCEGLLMYLRPAAVEGLLQALRARSAALEICLSFVQPGSLGRLHRSLERRNPGGGLRWTCDAAGLERLARRCGFALTELSPGGPGYGEDFARLRAV